LGWATIAEVSANSAKPRQVELQTEMRTTAICGREASSDACFTAHACAVGSSSCEIGAIAARVGAREIAAQCAAYADGDGLVIVRVVVFQHQDRLYYRSALSGSRKHILTPRLADDIDGKRPRTCDLKLHSVSLRVRTSRGRAFGELMMTQFSAPALDTSYACPLI